jgi:ubiquinone/menaquinone biosynthesis C-methylase UbiE
MEVSMTRGALFIPILSLALVSNAGAQDQRDTADAKRLIEALEVRPGQTVCELGVGDGALSMAMARTVGESGRVYANELNKDRLRKTGRAIEKARLTNVTLVEGHEDRTNLPELTCDALFMRNVYHHFADPPTMNASIRQALKPGGRVAVIDFPPRGTEADKPEDRDADGHHGVTANTVTAELKAASFEVVSNNTHDKQGFLVVARKP